MKKIILMMSLILSLAIITACSTNDTQSVSGEETNAATEETTTEGAASEDENGTTESSDSTEEVATEKEYTFDSLDEPTTITVPAQVNKVVVIGYEVLDVVDALGLKDLVVGVPDPTSPMFPSFLQGYEEVTSVGGFAGDDLEAIAGLQPDLIIGGGRAASAYEDLSEIAPTAIFTIPGMNGTGFEERLTQNIQDIAYLLNAPEAAEAVVAQVTAEIDQLKAAVEATENKEAMLIITTGKMISMYTDNPESRYGFVYNELGFDPVADVTELAEEDLKVNDGEASRHGNSISFEFISAKDPDYILVIDRGTTIGQSDEVASDVLDNPLVQGTKAAQNNHIIYLDGTAWYLATGGVEASVTMVEDLSQGLEE